MRSLAIAACLAVTSCAPAPDAGVFYYKGAYVPGSALVFPNGSFVAHTGFLVSGDPEMARSAAFHRLRRAGEARGFTHAVIEEPKMMEPFGYGIVLEGALYKAADAPREAIRLSSIGEGESETVRRSAPAISRKPKPEVQIAAQDRVIQAHAQAAPSKPVDDGSPVVIMAPDY